MNIKLKINSYIKIILLCDSFDFFQNVLWEKHPFPDTYFIIFLVFRLITIFQKKKTTLIFKKYNEKSLKILFSFYFYK